MNTARATRSSTPRSKITLSLLAMCLAVAVGCQQKMAEQPALRPYEQSSMFEFKQSARPLENGVFHRNQLLPDNPLVTWLTPQGKAVKADPEWVKQVDPLGKTMNLPVGAPTDVKNFVDEFPFEMKEEDFKRGQVVFNAVCAECHGAAGHADGKIPERGFLRPPSYHRDPEGKKNDYSRLVVNPATNRPEPDYTGNPQGTSRGFYLYKNNVVGIDQVPVGYIFQVITMGFGAMGSHETQIPNPADRWRVIAYIRALQLSQSAKVADLSKAQKDLLDKSGAK